MKLGDDFPTQNPMPTMKKSAYIDVDKIFGSVSADKRQKNSGRTIMLNEAATTYRKVGEQSIFEQEYKGRYGYLHHVELVLSQPLVLDINVKISDLFAVYLLQGKSRIKLKGKSNQTYFKLYPRNAVYAYLPIGNYKLHINPGTTQIFGFYFDVGCLDGLPEKDTYFLEELRIAHKTKSPLPAISESFQAGSITTAFIQQLGRDLTKGKWDSQVYVLSQLQFLIRLSKEKIDKKKSIHRQHAISAETIMKMIENGVDAKGMEFSIESLGRDLPLSTQQLNILFKSKKGLTLTAYKKHYLIKKSYPLLIQKTSVLKICELLSFRDDRTFYRLFKWVTGMSTREYLQKIQSEGNFD
ncbi:helix-turn-helix domain-containing protein [Sphingobacterium deserti]|nr:helix-turn-helix domain-containing protein [Sphingobacterium deserti]